MGELSNTRTTVFRGKHVTAIYESDKAGLAPCAVGPELRESCERLVRDKALPYAVHISPVDTGRYISSWQIHITDTVIRDLRRVAVQLWNMSDHALYVEVGASTKGGKQKNKARHVLTETIDFLNGQAEAFSFGENL